MRIVRLLVFAGVLAAAVAVPGTGFANRPVAVEHSNFTTAPVPTNFCGVDGSSYETGVATFRSDATGGIVVTENVTLVFTATATGKVLDDSESILDHGTLKDTGDGTESFREHVAGLLDKLSIPNGPILKAADGEPLRATGNTDIRGTIDLATGELLSSSTTMHGPTDSTGFCDPAVAYLTS